MAGTTGLEPATSAVTGQRSNQLSYVPRLSCNNLSKCHIERADSRVELLWAEPLMNCQFAWFYLVAAMDSVLGRLGDQGYTRTTNFTTRKSLSEAARFCCAKHRSNL